MHPKEADGKADSVGRDQIALIWVCTNWSDLAVPIFRNFTCLSRLIGGSCNFFQYIADIVIVHIFAV